MEKKCCTCNNPKPFTDFSKNKASKDGLQSACKICQKISYNQWKEQNIDKVKFDAKNYRSENSNKWVGYSKKYRDKSENKVKREIWNIENKQYYVDYEQKPTRKAYRKNYNKNSITHKWRMFLKNTLKRVGKSKEGKTIDLLGYSAIQLKEHLEKQFTNGMSWNNHGDWHIDHIRPLSSFSPDTPINIINALDNLQPLWAKDNIKKSNKTQNAEA
jgi:hypothetical protein